MTAVSCETNPYLTAYNEVMEMTKGVPYSVMAWERRSQLVRKYAWAIPTEEAIRAINRYCPTKSLISIGAGTGYWEALIAASGIEVVAYDSAPPSKDKKNPYKHVVQYYPVRRGTERFVTKYPYHTLFLCWPCYSTSMAYRAATRSKAEYLVYVGEGSGGCTADDDFHEYLDRCFDEVETVWIPQWEGIHDRVQIYRRKGV